MELFDPCRLDATTQRGGAVRWHCHLLLPSLSLRAHFFPAYIPLPWCATPNCFITRPPCSQDWGPEFDSRLQVVVRRAQDGTRLPLAYATDSVDVEVLRGALPLVSISTGRGIHRGISRVTSTERRSVAKANPNSAIQ